jgi:hypothetical protein
MALFQIFHNKYLGKNCPIVSEGGIIKKMIGNSVEGSDRELSWRKSSVFFGESEGKHAK